MFQFFINLSGDKSQSNVIPEAIHLCDGLMASGYPPELYCMLIILEHFYSLNINNKLITNILNLYIF